MTRSVRRTLHYRVLGAMQVGRHSVLIHVSASRPERSLERFERQLEALFRRTVQSTRQRKNTGAKTADKLLTRIKHREAELARRSALDLQRLEDMEERYQQRRVQALRQEWFVLGRIVADAMSRDAGWRSRILPLLHAAPLTRTERIVLGLGAE